MATTEHPKRGSQAMSRLDQGFATLTLDPSARLRSLGESQREKATMREVWKSVGRTLVEAMVSLSRSLSPPNR